jgi:hypothetical protein
MEILNHFCRSVKSHIARLTTSRRSKSSATRDLYLAQASVEALSFTMAKDDTGELFELPASGDVSLGEPTAEEGNYSPEFKT